MKRPRVALCLFMVTFATALLAVGFFGERSQRAARAATPRPRDMGESAPLGFCEFAYDPAAAYFEDGGELDHCEFAASRTSISNPSRELRYGDECDCYDSCPADEIEPSQVVGPEYDDGAATEWDAWFEVITVEDACHRGSSASDLGPYTRDRWPKPTVAPAVGLTTEERIQALVIRLSGPLGELLPNLHQQAGTGLAKLVIAPYRATRDHLPTQSAVSMAGEAGAEAQVEALVIGLCGTLGEMLENLHEQAGTGLANLVTAPCRHSTPDAVEGIVNENESPTSAEQDANPWNMSLSLVDSARWLWLDGNFAFTDSAFDVNAKFVLPPKSLDAIRTASLNLPHWYTPRHRLQPLVSCWQRLVHGYADALAGFVGSLDQLDRLPTVRRSPAPENDHRTTQRSQWRLEL